MSALVTGFAAEPGKAPTHEAEPVFVGEVLPVEERTLGTISTFLDAIASAESVTIYEGLPHQMWDEELYAIEAKRADILWLQGYPFYDRPLEVAAGEKKKLTTIVLRKESHVPFRGYKLCGGYHPDYAIVWEKNGAKSGSLICFGCHEWKNFTPKAGYTRTWSHQPTTN